MPPQALDRRLSQAALDEVVAEYSNGGSAREIGDRLGISRNTVLRLVERHGVKRQVSRMSEQDRARAIQLYKNGLSLAAVGQELGRNPRTIRDLLVQAGIERRDTHGRTKT
jgi:IS30 family transposase